MVSFAAEPIIRLGNFAITNTFLDMLLVDAIIIGIIALTRKKLALIPSKLQMFVEILISEFYSITESVAGKNSSKIFPYFMTFFLFILIANWTGLIPGLTAIGLKHGEEIVPFLRPLTSDFNGTLGLAIVSAAATHIMAIQTVGIRDYLSRYLSFNPLYLFIGTLEIISELTKIVSLSFRLFGNVYAGEVVMHTVSSIFAFIFPLPFLSLEFIVGLVQALVFSMLTMAFMAILTTPHHAEEVSH